LTEPKWLMGPTNILAFLLPQQMSKLIEWPKWWRHAIESSRHEQIYQANWNDNDLLVQKAKIKICTQLDTKRKQKTSRKTTVYYVNSTEYYICLRLKNLHISFGLGNSSLKLSISVLNARFTFVVCQVNIFKKIRAPPVVPSWIYIYVSIWAHNQLCRPSNENQFCLFRSI